MPQKEYIGGVAATTLASDMTDVATTFSVSSGGGSSFPTGGTYPFVVVIGRNTPSEELILCSSRSGDTFTVASSGRGYDGTTAVAHTGGPVVEHCIDAGVINEASAHIFDTSAAHAASAISYAGGTGMAATDVEAAIDELATEKANLSGGTFTGDISVPDEAYDATAWNGSLEVPTKNAIRDKFEAFTPTLTSTSASLGADVTMSVANTFYDGPSISLAAGTWLVTATVTTHDAGSSGGEEQAKLWDGTTVAASTAFSRVGGAATLPLSAVVTPGSTTTYKVSVACTQTNHTIKAATPNNGAGNNASRIVAVKIA